jgi:uncharacterized protein
MPITPTYPGVYIEELPSPVRTIVGVGTSTAAFIGPAIKGPFEATKINSFGEYEDIFGGLWKKSNMSYAVYQYFINGGTEAIIVRVVPRDPDHPTNDAKPGRFETGATTLKFVAANPGLWAKDFKIRVDDDIDKTKDDPSSPHLFNLEVIEIVNGQEVVRERYINVSSKKDNIRFIYTILKEESDLVFVDGNEDSVPTGVPPMASPPGTTSTKKILDFNYVNDSASDGVKILPNNVMGSKLDPKSGIYALDNTDIFNMLCIPPYDESGTTSNVVYTEASSYCKVRRAMLLVDSPSEWKKKTDPIDTNIGINASGQPPVPSRDENAAIFFPRIIASDPLEEGRTRTFVPCGAVAGVIARTDTQRGVWKAPAGIEAILMGVSDLQVRLTDPENGDLNKEGINCLRIIPVAGKVVWGSRTMKGADRLADQWKYLSVRRTALFIEESLYRGTQWVVFEPNDEPLWSQIRLNVGAFMHDLFRKGAFQGSTPKEAYLVKCDKETTTQYDIDRGIVNILVGFAPLKPAEFVMIKIQQLAGQAEEK